MGNAPTAQQLASRITFNSNHWNKTNYGNGIMGGSTTNTGARKFTPYS